MEWFFIVLAIGVVALLALFVMATRHHGGASVPGRFDFERYKSEELAQRGLFDKTKWR